MNGFTPANGNFTPNYPEYIRLLATYARRIDQLQEQIEQCFEQDGHPGFQKLFAEQMFLQRCAGRLALDYLHLAN